ncbi:MAG: hypothetical protein MRJ92_09365 [Nitrospira sp.]|nr:hypothetical protein [Nitrospira sp.]
MRLAVRKDDEVSRDQRQRARLAFKTGMASSFGQQMKNDHVFGVGGEVGRHRVGVGLAHAPRSRKFTVKEHRAVELDGL